MKAGRDAPEGYWIQVRFRQLGLTPGKTKAPEEGGTTIRALKAGEGEEKAAEIQALILATATKLVPGLAKKEIHFRITTPDGEPWTLPGFVLEEPGTGARYGYGTFVLTDPHGQVVEVGPWSGS